MYQATNQITGSKRWLALGAVMITMFFSALDQTIVSTAVPVIIGDLEGFSIYAWVFTAYMMASSITVPIYGKLSDIYGRKPFYLFGLATFMVGSALSGQAQTMLQLIVFRAVQGIGGGAMMSMPRATIGDIFNPRERGKWMGLISSIFGLASILGPVVGGWITDHYGWRWIFYINLPVGLLAIIAVAYALPKVRIERQIKLDWLGSLLLVLGLVPILLGFTWAGNVYPWGSVQVVALFAAGALFMGLFFLNEKKTAEPLIAPELFKESIFSVSLVIGLLVSMGFFGSLMFLPLFVQGVIGLSPEHSGIVLTPMMLSFIIGSIIGGQIVSRTGRYKLQAITGTFIMVIGAVLLAQLKADATWVVVVRNMIILGLGVGSVLPLLNVAVLNVFPYRIMGVVNSTQQFARSLGGVIASPILGTILANSFSRQLVGGLSVEARQAIGSLPDQVRGELLNPQSLTNSQAQEAIKTQFASLGSRADLIYGQFITAVKEALTTGINHIFLVSVFFALAALVLSFFLKEIRLKTDEFYSEEA